MIIVYILIGLVAGFVFTMLTARKNVKKESSETERKLSGLKSEMEQKLKEQREELEKQKIKIKEEFEKSTSETRSELKREKEEIEQKTKNLDRKADIIETREAEILKREKDIEHIQVKYKEKEKELEEIKNKEQTMLQEIARMSPKEAREQLMKRIEEEAQEEAKRNYGRIVENAKRDAQRQATKIIAQAIQRNASDITQELTVTTVAIPDDDMKGRIIGREGRNIRTLEAETGVNLIIDDTPGVITISSFDGVRREVAKRSLELLVKDGRIQPARIEEIVNKVKKEVDEIVKKAGEEAALETGVVGVHDEVIHLLGKLKFRTSYGQNVLDHSIGVSHLAGIMADELNLDGNFARRAGLLHDIGKAVDREMQGGHADLGAKLAKKYGESERLQNAILAHHEGIEPQTSEAILIQAADTISASRPGARREQLENYVKRMTEIENIAKGFEGVSDAYCLSAGREIRIIVEPNKISDLDAANIAKMCAKKIEETIDFPGEIKVTVIRSMRSTEVAQ